MQKMRIIQKHNLYINQKKIQTFQENPNFRNFEMLKTCFLLFLVEIRGWDGLY